MRRRRYNASKTRLRTTQKPAPRLKSLASYDEITKVTERVNAEALALRIEERVRKVEKQYVMPKAALERAMTI